MAILRSDQIEQLAMALAKAQGQMKPPQKRKTATILTKDSRSYQYHYADLADIVAAISEPLSKNGIAFSQLIDAEGPCVVTMLLHESGQYLGCSYDLPTGCSPQAFGSALTYAKRYSLASLTGIVAEDDDDGQQAEAVVHKNKVKPPTQKPIALKASSLPFERSELMQKLREIYVPYMKAFPEADLGTAMMEKYGAKKAADMSDEQAYEFFLFLKSEIEKGRPV